MSLGANRAPHARGRSAAWRHDVGWLAILTLVLQILLTTASFHIGATGLSGPAVPLCLAHDLSADDGAQAAPSEPPLHHPPLAHEDCPICQTAAAVSASLAPVVVEIIPLRAGSASRPPAAPVEGKRLPLSSQAQPRAPPNRA